MNQNKNQNQGQQSQNPNRNPAEGSRDNVRGNKDRGDEAGGISNRPLEREDQEQRDLPNRGQSREENR